MGAKIRKDKHIPEQVTGTVMNAVEKVQLNSEAEAMHFFKMVCDRLLDVNSWAEIAGIPMSTFTLTDLGGKEVKRKAMVGDHLKINVPGPGSKTGDGYDWVQIEEIKREIQTDAELLSMTARPAPNPLKEDPHTAHFLTAEATSTFQIRRIGNIVYAEEHGRNEVPNTNTSYTMDNIRNTMVGWAAKIGFSYPQWKALVKGLLNRENLKHN